MSTQPKRNYPKVVNQLNKALNHNAQIPTLGYIKSSTNKHLFQLTMSTRVSAHLVALDLALMHCSQKTPNFINRCDRSKENSREDFDSPKGRNNRNNYRFANRDRIDIFSWIITRK